MFRFVGSNSLSKARTTGSGDSEPTFVQEYWEGEVEAGYEDLKSNLNLNPGQQAILEQNEEAILDYLYEVGEGFDPNDFINELTNILGDDKFNALSETFEQFAVDLEEDWDHSVGGDGYGSKKFLGMEF